MQIVKIEAEVLLLLLGAPEYTNKPEMWFPFFCFQTFTAAWNYWEILTALIYRWKKQIFPPDCLHQLSIDF